MFLHPPDEELAGRIDEVRARWGGSFSVVSTPDWKRLVREYPGPVVHLTMYGEPIERVLPRLRGERRVLLVVGGAKVPSELYRLSTWNAAVGHQPHSEVAAVAVTLAALGGIPGPRAPAGARQRVVPQVRGKKLTMRTAEGGWTS